MLVMAALVRRPRGLLSARAVAAATGTSPTTASAALSRLEARDLVERRVETRLMRGRSRPMPVWYARLLTPAVQEMLGQLGRVTLPAPPAHRNRGRLPDHLWHLVWNAEPREIDLEQDAAYLAHRILTTADPEGTAWGAATLPPGAWRQAESVRGTSDRDRAWAHRLATTTTCT